MEEKKVVREPIKTKAVKTVVQEKAVDKVVEVNVVGEKPAESKTETINIFDKYRKYINTVKDGYLRNIDYESAMEMLRYIEKRRSIKLGLNMNCASCMIELVSMFSRLEDK